ncbi:hypothetical protein [Catenulispora subtropica]|uniref:Uncharacterized protein n=1 Tax=Catenulispora subtropica TaxID=450798 RepID=A0ABN2T161_9ACTN
MARPTDWDVLDLDHDPTPGDPFRIKEIGKRLQDLGDEAERAARDVRGLAGDPAAMNWIGASGDEFRDHIGKFPGQLDKVANSHHMCASALLDFANALDGHQSQADRALTQARPLHDQVKRLQDQLHAANADLTSANKGVDAAHAASTVDPTAVHNAVQSQTNAKSAVDSLNSQLSGPAAQLEALKKLARSAEDLRHGDEDTARSKINAATDAGIAPDSFWHKVGEIASAVWHGLVIVAKIVSFVGAIVLMIVGGPLWLIVAVVVAGLIILADTLYKYSQGKASLWDVGLAVLACIPITKGFTSMAAVADAFRAGGMLGAGLHVAGAIGGAAKDLVVGMSALLRGGMGRMVAFFGDGARVADESLGAFRAGFTPWTEGGPVVSVNRLVRELGQAGFGDLARQFEIQRVPIIRDPGGGFGWGYSPLTVLKEGEKPIIQISHRGLSSMDEAIKTFFHETYHWDTFFKMGVGGTEDAAEAHGVKMWQEVMRRLGK